MVNFEERIQSSKSISLYDLHEELTELVKKNHPDLFDQRNFAEYNIAPQNITDSYKALLHVFLLKRIPKLSNDGAINYNMLIEGMLRTHGCNSDREKIKEIKVQIEGLVDKFCGKMNRTI